MNRSAAIRHIFISPGHNFFGRYGQPADRFPTHEVAEVACRAGWGLEGDRFYGYRPDYKGQVTFFAWETFLAVREKFSVPALSPGAFRRNLVVEGLDLNALIGCRFALGDVEFEGMDESRPCHWMNQVVAAGAEDWLRGRGGLRARVLSNGKIAVGAVAGRLVAEPKSPVPRLEFSR